VEPLPLTLCEKFGRKFKLPGPEYVNLLSAELLTSIQWREYIGMNIFLPGVGGYDAQKAYDDNYYINLLSHATYFVSDYDSYGYYPKDVIIPVYREGVIKYANSDLIVKENLLYCSGWDGRGFLKTRISNALKLVGEDVVFSNVNNTRANIRLMIMSKFCIVSRSDDSSSVPLLYSAIVSDCIPVIVSDHVQLPFKRFINYTSFCIFVSESDILNYPNSIVDHLKNMTDEKLSEMVSNLKMVKNLLFYDSLHSLNPVTLMFADALLKRIDNCIKRTTSMTKVFAKLYELIPNSLCHRIEKLIAKKTGIKSLKDLSKKFTPRFESHF
jgi:hypothetical protein